MLSEEERRQKLFASTDLPTTTYMCEFCGNPFEWFINSSVKYCSSACSELAASSKKIQEKFKKKMEIKNKNKALLPTQYLKNGKIKNRVKKMQEISVDILLPGGPYYMELDKFSWMCKTCGRIWAMRKDAEDCHHDDYVFKGKTKFYCLAKEEV